MKNVTISMDENTLAWVRVKAAEAGQSVSRWISQLLTESRARGADDDVEEAIRAIDEFLATPEIPISENGKAFDRNELYDSDERFRRFDDLDLPRGSERTGQENQGPGVGEGPHPFEGAPPKPPGSE